MNSSNKVACCISVCMATFNGEPFIEQQLQSILCQLEDNDEVIISDDSSTDKTIEIIKQFDDSRIRLLENQRFKSPTFNFQNALIHASGDCIFLSDQDDVWLSGKVLKVIEALQEADLVINNCNFIDEHNNIIGESYFKVYNSGPGVLKNFTKSTYLGNCMAFNRKVLDTVLPFPEELKKLSKFSMFHDGWIGLIADLQFKVVFLPEILSSFRRHSNNVSPTDVNAKSPNSLYIKIWGRCLLLFALINRVIVKA